MASTNVTTTSQIDNVTVTELDSITCFNLDNDLVFVLEELQNCTIQNSEETVDVTGKKGRKIDKLKRNKSVTITGSNGLVSAGLIAQQTGGVYEYVDEAEVSWNESITLDDPTVAILSHEAIGTVGAEIEAVVLEKAGGALDTLHQLRQGATAEAGTFTYDPLTRALGFAEDEFEEGDTIRVFYKINMPVARVDNPADTFSQMGHIIIDCTVRDSCGREYHGQFDIPKADFSGNFNLDLGQDQTVHNFEIEALASVGNCDGNKTKTKSVYWSFKAFVEPEAIETPELVEGDPSVNRTALSTQIDTVENDIKDIKVSDDGENDDEGTALSTGDIYVSSVAKGKIDAALTAAKDLLAKTDATQDEIDAGVEALQAAEAELEGALETKE